MQRCDDGRDEWAARVIQVLEREPEVNTCFPRGSYATRTMDEYSDIDLGVDVSGYDNGRFALRLPEVLGRHFALEFHDWAPSLLPSAYVQTFYLRDLPVFWSIDIECVASPHVPSVKDVAVDEADHLLKLWVLNAKYLLRGRPESPESIRKFAARVMDGEVGEGISSRRLMEGVLRRLAQIAAPSRGPFLAKCEEVLHRIP